MKKFYPVIEKVALFKGLKKEEYDFLENQMFTKVRKYAKSEFIFDAGELVSKVGIVLKGKAQVIKEDVWGNRTILANLAVGDIFGEAFCCSEQQRLTVSVVAGENVEILFINYNHILSTHNISESCKEKLIANMIQILANKNVMLTQKIEVLSRRTTREKILSFLSNMVAQGNSYSFEIPFNRQELADFLCVDRSALSSELSKLQKEEILKYNKNHFVILQEDMAE